MANPLLVASNTCRLLPEPACRAMLLMPPLRLAPTCAPAGSTIEKVIWDEAAACASCGGAAEARGLANSAAAVARPIPPVRNRPRGEGSRRGVSAENMREL